MWRYVMTFLLSLIGPIGTASADFVPVELLVNGDGKLYGAKNVLVRDTRLDVSFVDGTCMSVFDGCDAMSDFPYAQFHDDLARALLDQVFIGEFDSAPNRTYGCSFLILCVVASPTYASTASDDLAWVLASNGDDDRVFDRVEIGGNAARSQLDFTREIAYVWGVWSASAVQQVPEPASMALVLAGLLALVSIRYGSKRPFGRAMSA